MNLLVARKTAKVRTLTVESVGDSAKVLCGTSGCRKPFLAIEDGEVRFLSKHGSAMHENILTKSQLEMLLVEIARQLLPYERW